MLAKTKYRNMEYAKKYDNKRYGGLLRGIKNRNTHKVVKKALSNIVKGGSILDLPCGTGRFAELCVTEGFNWTGADISYEMMRVSQLKQKKSSRIGGHIQCDGENIPLKTNSVDATLTIRVLLQFPRETRIKVLSELGRISRKYVIVDYNHSDNIKHFVRNCRNKLGLSQNNKVRLSLNSIKEEIQESGLIIEKILPVSKLFSDDAIFVCRMD